MQFKAAGMHLFQRGVRRTILNNIFGAKLLFRQEKN